MMFRLLYLDTCFETCCLRWLLLLLLATVIPMLSHAVEDDCAAGDGLGSTESFDVDMPRVAKDSEKNPVERFAPWAARESLTGAVLEVPMDSMKER